MTNSEVPVNEAGPQKKPFTIVVMGQPGSGKSTLITALYYYIMKHPGVLSLQMNIEKKNTKMLRDWVYGFTNRFVPKSHGNGTLEFDFSMTSSTPIEKNDLTLVEIDLPHFEFFENKNYQPMDFWKNGDLFLLTLDSKRIETEDVYFSFFFNTIFPTVTLQPMIIVLTKYDLLKPNQKPQVDVLEYLGSSMPATFKWFKYSKYKIAKFLKFSVGSITKAGYSFDRTKSVEEFDLSYCESLFTTIYGYLNNGSSTTKDNARVQLENDLEELRKKLVQEPDNPDILLAMKRIYEQLGEEGKAKTVDDTLEKLEERKKFAFNLNNPVSLQKFEINHLDFFGELNWRFQPQVNVLLGKNGYGKTHLLRLLAALLQTGDEKIAGYFENSKDDPSVNLVVERNKEFEFIRRTKIVFEESIGKVPFLAIPDLRMMDKSKTAIGPPDDEKTGLKENGAYHFLYQKPYDGLIRAFLYQLCIDYMDKGKTFDLPIFRLIYGIIENLSEHQFRFHKITPEGQARFKIEVITEGNENPVPIQNASQGTLSILAMVGLIYSYLTEIFPDIPEEKLLKQPGIVLIDELDAHLHPSWQQKITGILRKHFPNVQFIVTAHSPLVVAGCREGEVSVLRKGKNGFVVEQFHHDFIGYQARELYQKIFDIEDKDLTYLYFTALSPFKGEIEKEISSLEEKKKSGELTAGEEKKLNQLYDDLHYTQRANEMFEKRRDYSRILRENKRLKSRIKRLEQENGKQPHAGS